MKGKKKEATATKEFAMNLHKDFVFDSSMLSVCVGPLAGSLKASKTVTKDFASGWVSGVVCMLQACYVVLNMYLIYVARQVMLQR